MSESEENVSSKPLALGFSSSSSTSTTTLPSSSPTSFSRYPPTPTSSSSSSSSADVVLLSKDVAALHSAIRNEDPVTVRSILKESQSKGRTYYNKVLSANLQNHTAKSLATAFGHQPTINAVNEKMPFSETDKQELFTAIVEGKGIVVQRILREGKEFKDLLLTSRDSKGWTCMHYAANNGNADILFLLVDNGANPELRDNRNRTPLDIAKEQGKREAIKFLSSTDAGCTVVSCSLS